MQVSRSTYIHTYLSTLLTGARLAREVARRSCNSTGPLSSHEFVREIVVDLLRHQVYIRVCVHCRPFSCSLTHPCICKGSKGQSKKGRQAYVQHPMWLVLPL